MSSIYRKDKALKVSRKVLVFEELRLSHIILLVWHCLLANQLFYLRKGPGMRGMFATLLIRWSGILPLTDKPLVYVRANAAGDLAFQAIENIYATYFKNHPQIRELVDRFQSDDLHLAFQKMLTEELEIYYYYDLLFSRIEEICGCGSPTVFVPSAFRTISAYESLRPLFHAAGLPTSDVKSVFFHFGFQFLAHLDRVLQRCLYVLYLMYCFAISSLGRLWRKRAVCMEAEYGVTLMSPLREFSDDINGIGFIFDGNRITPENTLFIAQCRLNRKDLAELQQRNFRYLSLKDLYLKADSDVFIENMGTILRLAFRGPEWILRTGIFVIREFALWTGFLKHGRIRHLITYCDFGTRHIPRNVLLKKARVRTWYYADTTNQSGNWGIPQYRVAYWGFLFYDNYVAWNRGNSVYQQMHKQRIGQYCEVGVLWSESVRLIGEGKMIPEGYQQLQDKVKALSGGGRIIAVFDSSFNNYTVTTYSHAVAFARDICRLLNERPDLTVIFKEKKHRSIHQGWQDSMGLDEVYGALEAHPRCLMVGHQVSRAIVISLADLTISFPFTSTTLEALGARRRAIFHDATSDFTSTCYANIPGLTVHGYKELSERVEELLCKTSDEAYWDYMERELKGKIDPYLDGMAMTRFRNMLTAETP